MTTDRPIPGSFPKIITARTPQITVGWGARHELVTIIDSIGGIRSVLVIHDPALAGIAMFEQLISQLASYIDDLRLFAGIRAEPNCDVFEAANRFGDDVMPDCVIGIGGGSALDVAKVVALRLNSHQPLAEMFGINQATGTGLPTILLPTTAGTGSEVTPIAVVSDEAAHLKKGIVSDRIMARHAIIDPEMCVSLPPGPTAYTGMDALTHAIEAYTNRHAVPLIDGYALQAIAWISSHLRVAFADGTDIAARTAMSLGSLFGGYCLGPVNTAAVHALAYPLGGQFHIPHGVANAMLLPHVMRFNEPAVGVRHAEIARAMQASDAVAAIEDLSADVGTNRQLREFGIAWEDLPQLASAAMEVTRLLNNNPRTVERADALAIYERAW